VTSLPLKRKTFKTGIAMNKSKKMLPTSNMCKSWGRILMWNCGSAFFCGSGSSSKWKFGSSFGNLEFSVVDPDPDPYWIRIQLGLWIRIRIRDPDPDPGGQK
jgi:hypothetical protein